ncbi:MAG: nitrate/sulfonate/bicarbonate ABC transporter ATP-binding protein [Verrucomicrobia bacterium]|nr:nitrate/sulfonate/bicarbonate ABC transporter ATP-binding protein [Verrucomicrobiota bacterium]
MSTELKSYPETSPTKALKIAELRSVSKTFHLGKGRELKVLDQIDLAVHEGELFALLGQSGSGKSTLLRCLTGLTEPSSGQVLCYDKPLVGVNPYASIVFQTFALYPWLTVEQNVEVGLIAKRNLTRAQKSEAVEKAIDLIGLNNYHSAFPREISGGMRQRVGIARALVSEPKILCLDEAFSALDVLTAEGLRGEVVGLWRGASNTLSSIFMVTHNIEEAVEMATRICILFPHPGRLGLILENNLPYPRNSNHPEFQRLMKVIHETITQQALPDLPPEPPPAPGKPVSRARTRMESIPTVGVNQILGLISILHDSPDLDNIYDVSDEIGRDFGETIAIVKAGEILEFVNTPKDEVKLTDLGKRFFESDRQTRKTIFAEQVQKLRLFHIILGYLEVQEEVSGETVMHDIAAALPYENPEKILKTMIAWGRYAGLMDFNANTGMVVIPEDEEEEEEA